MVSNQRTRLGVALLLECAFRASQAVATSSDEDVQESTARTTSDALAANIINKFTLLKESKNA